MSEVPARSRAVSLGAAALMLLALAGCVGIPSSGNVTVGEAIEERDAGVEFFPLGPDPGATQDEVLRGFVAAASSSADDYGVARQFLARGFAGKWNPRAGVSVRTSTERVALLDALTMEYSIQVAADINAAGSFQQNDMPAPLTLAFGFVKEKGEWRIETAADGIVLSDVVFQSTFDPHAVYFLDPTGSSDRDAHLQGAVRSAFPDGTRLEASTVEVQDGIADVDLTTEALTAGADERRLMQVQLAASFARVANVREVSISVGGTPLPIGGLTASDPVPNPRVDSRAIVRIGDRFGYLSDSSVTTIPGLAPGVLATSPTAVTVAVDLGSAVSLGSGSVWLVPESGAEPRLIDARPGLIPPSLDNYQWVWSASSLVPGFVRITDFEGVGYDLPTGFAADSQIVSLDVARDGARVAIHLQTPAGPRLVVRAISRDATANQRPRVLSEAVLDTTIATMSAGTALDSTWVDDLSVATLVREGDDSSVTVHQIGGRRAALGSATGATSLVGGNGERGLRALGPDGVIIERGVSGWSNTGIAVAFIATQR